MKFLGRVLCAFLFSLSLQWGFLASPGLAAEQNPQLEVGPSRPVRQLGVTLATSLLNSVYVPARFALTASAAVIGGCVGLLNGGDPEAAAAIWESTDGDAFITPAMIEQRRGPRFGPRH